MGMTIEEAKDLLDNLIGMLTDNHESDYDSALKMGIKALERDSFLEFLMNTINPNEMEKYITMYHSKDDTSE